VGLAAAATSISATVIAVSSSLDKLYWASQRTGASVASMRSLSYAVSQVGGEAAQAMGAFEGLAAALRTSPGVEGVLNNAGIVTRQNGQLKETGQLLDDIVKTFGQRPYYQSSQIAGMLGIGDERAWNTFVTQWSKIREFQKQQIETAKSLGVDPDRAAEASKDLMQAVRRLLETVTLLSDKVVIELQPKLIKLLTDLQEWFVRHRDDIVKAVENIIDAVKGLVDDFGALVKAMAPVIDQFSALTKTIDGGDNSLKLALEGILVYMTGKWLLGIIGVFSKIGGAWALVAAMLALSSSFTSGTGKDIVNEPFGTTGPNGMAGDWIDAKGVFHQVAPSPVKPPSLWQRFKRAIGLESAYTPAIDASGMPMPSNPGMSGLQPAFKDKLTRMFDAMPPEVRAGIEIRSGYRSPERQAELWAQALAKYGSVEEARKWVAPPGNSQHNKGNAADLGFSSPEVRKWVHDHASEFGLTFPLSNENWHIEDEDARKHSEVLNAARNFAALGALSRQSSYLMSPTTIGGNISRSASLHQKTDITIIGSADPAGTSAALGGAQSRLAGEMIRNAQSAFV
jgi:hypothetical protein